MSLEHNLEPRSVLPYTDDEIRELYLRSQYGSGDEKTIEQSVGEQAASKTPVIIEAVTLTILAYGFTYIIVQSIADFAWALWVAAFVFVIIGGLLARMVQTRAIGPLSWLVRQRTRNETYRKLWEVNPLDPEVLSAVVHHLAEEPLSQAARLRTAIEEDMARIDGSLRELPELAASLRAEIARTGDEGMKVLLEAKHTAALQTTHKLQQIALDLARQADQAESAVRPIRDLCTRFEHVQRLSTSLARIQAAHGLIEESQSRLDDHRLQLQLLKAASLAASTRLKEIELAVHAHELAEAEVQINSIT